MKRKYMIISTKDGLRRSEMPRGVGSSNTYPPILTY
jgi:hypothetical protein